ncbi:MAG: hypothetical protein E7354_02425 [Clostridiales bacterium]|nr:hypothetical protein [Clostridiales bacterium]
MEPKTYYENLVKTYASHDASATLDVIEPMASVPASMKLREKGIHLVVRDGKLCCVNSELAKSLRRYCEKSGVLETALSASTAVTSVDAEASSVVLEADAQLAER